MMKMIPGAQEAIDAQFAAGAFDDPEKFLKQVDDGLQAMKDQAGEISKIMSDPEKLQEISDAMSEGLGKEAMAELQKLGDPSQINAMVTQGIAAAKEAMADPIQA